MKVLHLGKFYPPYFGGIEKVNFDLVEGLNNKGIKTDVLCFNHGKGSELDTTEYKTIRTSTITSAFSSPISFSIFRMLRQIYLEYDIIHIHLPNPMAALALQSIPYSGKVVVHWHSDIIKQKFLKKLYKPLQDKLLMRADRIIATTLNYLEGSDDLRNYRKKTTVIPLGISNSEFHNDTDFRNILEERYKNKKVIFSLGRLIYYKGFKYLVEAAKDLPDNYIVLIGGVGTLKDSLEKQIVENNLQQKVVLLGKIPFNHLGEYYRRADIYCMSSIERSEAFGVVQIEAMSFGCPIVCTNIVGSGVPWVNVDNVTGIVVEPEDSKALSDAFIEIIEDNEKRERFSKNAIARYNTEFQLELMIDRTLDLYQSLLNQ